MHLGSHTLRCLWHRSQHAQSNADIGEQEPGHLQSRERFGNLRLCTQTVLESKLAHESLIGSDYQLATVSIRTPVTIAFVPFASGAANPKIAFVDNA